MSPTIQKNGKNHASKKEVVKGDLIKRKNSSNCYNRINEAQRATATKLSSMRKTRIRLWTYLIESTSKAWLCAEKKKLELSELEGN